MKALVISDIHGVESAVPYLEKAISTFSPSKIIILGDIDSVDSYEVVRFIRKYKDVITAVCGNCDYQGTDEDLYEISLPHYACLIFEGKTIHMSHTCQYVSFPAGEIIMYGHTHVKDLHKENGVIYLNPGSVGRPRDGSSSIAILDEEGIKLLDLKSLSILNSIEY